MSKKTGLRLKTILFGIITLFFSAVYVENDLSANGVEAAKDFSQSSSEIVMEMNSKRVLYANNIHEKKYMASTTKILTAIVIIENCNLNAVVTVGKNTTGIEGSSIYLEEGETLTVTDLLYGLMLRSGNDCAETLAVFCSGSIEKFAALMNETAKKIGALNSNFVNPHGLNNENHYTTAYDLALISCYAMQNADF
ncbi:MAG: D-alanyl-D-alanine carboxypeptidase, partial [Clostridia bacterium]|nr:D-alanyl-D-alanine carboxypeptidase [Clostridia bacterium]